MISPQSPFDYAKIDGIRVLAIVSWKHKIIILAVCYLFKISRVGFEEIPQVSRFHINLIYCQKPTS